MRDAWQNLILPDLMQMVQEDDVQGLAAFCGVVHPASVAEILEELEDPQVWRILDQADDQLRVEIFEFLSLKRQTELAESLDEKRLSHLLEWMSADDRVDLLSRIPEGRRENALRLIAQAERNEIRRMLSYDEDSAGAVMTSDYASLPASITVLDALARLRQQAPDSESIYYVYILGENRHLEGVISLRQLILARPETRLSEIMKRDPIRVRVTEPRVVAAEMLGRYNFIAVPIVDDSDRLVGIVTHDDALDVVQEEATEDAYLQSAMAPLEDTYQESPLFEILWKRGVWLLFLSFVALMNAHVIDHYRGTADSPQATQVGTGLSSLILLFLPLVMASGGNAGSQSATLFIRMFALRPSAGRGSSNLVNDLPLVARELLIGLCLGSALAFLDFTVAWLWFGRSMYESSVIAATVVMVVTLGTSAGSLLPLLFRRLGMDPAIMSNPLIAAMIDVLGVILFYEIGLLVLT
ncbi:MAG: hypothetical protein RLZZ458_2528 [Planctomycetota bacterium]|jgi:magnesium transporter